MPPGVLNILPGYGPTAGAAICTHHGVDKVRARLIEHLGGWASLQGPLALQVVLDLMEAELDSAMPPMH